MTIGVSTGSAVCASASPAKSDGRHCSQQLSVGNYFIDYIWAYFLKSLRA